MGLNQHLLVPNFSVKQLVVLMASQNGNGPLQSSKKMSGNQVSFCTETDFP